jgi:hypothetical protein
MCTSVLRLRMLHAMGQGKREVLSFGVLDVGEGG